MKLIILAAGIGSRLGKGLPKALVEVKDSRTILDTQLENFNNILEKKDILVVVGYKKELIMGKYPDLRYVYNPDYLITNTSKSLLCALREIEDEDVIFINGDIFFTKQAAVDISQCEETSFMVNSERTADEEVKYRLNGEGKICELSKQVENALGEAVGINFLGRKDLDKVRNQLEKVDDMDYFEKAFENLIITGDIEVSPLDINKVFVKEIDFLDDLDMVKKYISNYHLLD